MRLNLNKWMPSAARLQIDPPGSETVTVSSPSGLNRSFSIGIVHEHRFAFCHWADYAYLNKDWPPILLTLDSHNDVGATSDVFTDELTALDFRNRVMVGLYTWLRLPPLNDGHILPALYLDFFSDVFVLLNGKHELFDEDCLDEPTEYQDRHTKTHTVRYFTDPKLLIGAIPPGRDIYLDIDLDFFSDPYSPKENKKGAERQWPANSIRQFLTEPTGVIQSVLPSLVGLTIALEPQYCGGLINSHRALGIINEALFSDTLCTNAAKWKVKKPAPRKPKQPKRQQRTR